MDNWCTGLVTILSQPSCIMAAASPAGGAGEKVLWQYQDDLPSLPVPKLEDTMRRFLRSAEVFLSPEELQHTKAVIHEFQKSSGPELQAILEDKASDSRNWVRFSDTTTPHHALRYS